MGTVDFAYLRNRIAHEARRTFDAVRAAHPAERFYVFALYAYDDAVGVCPSANSEEAYARTAARQIADEAQTKWLVERGISPSASLYGDYRWSAYAWEYECAEADGFNAVDELINNHGMGAYDHDDPLGFVTFKARVLATMVLAFADLDEVEYFGSGMTREAVTLFCSVPNSECTVWLETDSARRLNPPGVFTTFEEQRLKYIADDSDRKPIAPNSVHALYLSSLQRSSKT